MGLSLADYLSDAGIGKWIAELGVTNAPVPRQGIKEALAFFSQCMPSLPPRLALSFLRCMDLSKPVRKVTLGQGEKVIAFRVMTEDPFKLFYARSGASKHTSGLNDAGRHVHVFQVRAPVIVLESFTGGAIDTWTRPSPGQPRAIAPRADSTGYMASGGGLQLIIPNAHMWLLDASR